MAHTLQVWQTGKLDHWWGSTHQYQRLLPRSWKVVPDHLLIHEALAIVPGIRGFVHCVPELEASRMFVPQFLQLRPQQDIFLGLVGKEQIAHGVVVWVLQDGSDHLQHWGDACPSCNHAYRLHRPDNGVGLLVCTDGKLPFALVDQ